LKGVGRWQKVQSSETAEHSQNRRTFCKNDAIHRALAGRLHQIPFFCGQKSISSSLTDDTNGHKAPPGGHLSPAHLKSQENSDLNIPDESPFTHPHCQGRDPCARASHRVRPAHRRAYAEIAGPGVAKEAFPVNCSPSLHFLTFGVSPRPSNRGCARRSALEIRYTGSTVTMQRMRSLQPSTS
jgi:hypothetical protein